MDALGRRLPEEMLVEVFAWLGEADLATLSGLDGCCLAAAGKVLARRGTALYRSGELVPCPGTRFRGLLIAGNILPYRLPTEVERLSIFLDTPCALHPSALARLLDPGLGTLTIGNAVLNATCSEFLLLSPSSSLVLIRGRLSRRARRLLLNHRELFQDLVIASKESLLAPNVGPSCRGLEAIELRKSAKMDSKYLNFFHKNKLSTLQRLHLTFAETLDLHKLSQLPLKHLTINNTNKQLKFNTGFHDLQSLTILNCLNVNKQTCQQISKIPNLQKLVLDLTCTKDVEQCLDCLYQSSLKTLIIIYSDICTFENTKLFESKMLRNVILKNYKHCCLTEESFKYIQNKSIECNFSFKYINIRTYQRSSYIQHKICKI